MERSFLGLNIRLVASPVVTERRGLVGGYDLWGLGVGGLGDLCGLWVIVVVGVCGFTGLSED